MISRSWVRFCRLVFSGLMVASVNLLGQADGSNNIPEPVHASTDTESNSLTLSADSLTYLLRGNDCYYRGTDSAKLYYSLAIEIDQSAGDAFFNRGVMYFDSGIFDSALSDFQSALSLNENDVQASFAGCCALICLGRFSEGSSCLSETWQSPFRRALIAPSSSIRINRFLPKGEPFPNSWSYFFPLGEGNEWVYEVGGSFLDHRYITDVFQNWRHTDGPMYLYYSELVMPHDVTWQVVQLGKGAERYVLVSSVDGLGPCRLPILSPGQSCDDTSETNPELCQLLWKIPTPLDYRDTVEIQEVVVTSAIHPLPRSKHYRRPFLISGFGRELTVGESFRFAADFEQLPRHPICHGRNLLSTYDVDQIVSHRQAGSCVIVSTEWDTIPAIVTLERPRVPISTKAGVFDDCIVQKYTWWNLGNLTDSTSADKASLTTESCFCRGVGLVKEQVYDPEGKVYFSMELRTYDVRHSAGK